MTYYCYLFYIYLVVNDASKQIQIIFLFSFEMVIKRQKQHTSTIAFLFKLLIEYNCSSIQEFGRLQTGGAFNGWFMKELSMATSCKDPLKMILLIMKLTGKSALIHSIVD